MICERGLTLVGITVSNLDGDGAAMQLELPFDGPGRSALDAVLDDVRDRYGPAPSPARRCCARTPAWRRRCCPNEKFPGDVDFAAARSTLG